MEFTKLELEILEIALGSALAYDTWIDSDYDYDEEVLPALLALAKKIGVMI